MRCKNRIGFNVTGSILALLMSSCGYERTDYFVQEKNVNMDGVKWISPSVRVENDARTYFQNSYLISPQGRLLLRREDLHEKMDTIFVDETHPVLLTLSLADSGNMTTAIANLKLCAVSKNWMMLATWEKAHPYGDSGYWKSQGADFVTESCLSPTQVLNEVSQIQFDVSELIQVRLTGMREAYGWILLSDNAEVEIVGDKDSQLFPRLQWTERYSRTVREEPFGTNP
jgi:hypothetical protein